MSDYDYPIDTCPLAALPLLIEARKRLNRLAAPRASRIADRIADVLEAIIDVAGDVEAYGNSWTGGEIGELADKLRAATLSYNQS